MIATLTIQGFQSHKDTTLNFDSGINVICGDSTVGKTSIIRAINLLLTGQPKKPIWASDSEVFISITYGNSKVVSVRKKVMKATTKTTYIYDSETYEMAKSDFDFGLNSINIQSQFEPFFILSMTPGKIAKLFQENCDIHIAEELKEKFSKDIKAVKNRIISSEDKLSDLQSKYDKLPDLDRLEILVKNFESFEQEIIKKNLILHRLKELAEFIEKEKRAKKDYRVFYIRIKKATDLFEKIEQINQDLEKRQKELGYLKKVLKFYKEIKSLEIDIDLKYKLYFKSLGDYCKYCGSKVDENNARRLL